MKSWIMQSKYVEQGDNSSALRHRSQTITYLTLNRWTIWCDSGEVEFHQQFRNAYSGLSAEEQVARNKEGVMIKVAWLSLRLVILSQLILPQCKLCECGTNL
jgi:hypothetical protein